MYISAANLKKVRQARVFQSSDFIDVDGFLFALLTRVSFEEQHVKRQIFWKKPQINANLPDIIERYEF
jgi:hypothetical protein